jgi:phosphoglycerol transferase MdoB-like AlkP superfamily enzyme
MLTRYTYLRADDLAKGRAGSVDNIMLYIAFISGIATILGFVLQALDAFSKHSELRKTLTTFIAGIFIGSVLGTLKSSNIALSIKLDGYTILLGVFIIIIITLLFLSARTDDESRRAEVYVAAAVATIIFLFILVFGSLKPYQSLTESELVMLAHIEAEKGEYARAITILNKAKNSTTHQKILDVIQNDINTIKKEQDQQLGNMQVTSR